MQRQPFNDKPVAIMSASIGILGVARESTVPFASDLHISELVSLTLMGYKNILGNFKLVRLVNTNVSYGVC